MMLVTSFGFTFFLEGAMNNLLAFFEAIQIILHLPMLSIIFPANVIALYEFIMPVVLFDIIPFDYSTGLLLDFDDELDERQSEDIPTQVQLLDYDSYNFWRLLGSLGIFLSWYFFQVFVYFIILKVIIPVSGYGKRVEKYLNETLFFSKFIFLFLE